MCLGLVQAFANKSLRSRFISCSVSAIYLIGLQYVVNDEIDEDEGRPKEGNGHWVFYRGKLYKAGKVGRMTEYRRKRSKGESLCGSGSTVTLSISANSTLIVGRQSDG